MDVPVRPAPTGPGDEQHRIAGARHLIGQIGHLAERLRDPVSRLSRAVSVAAVHSNRVVLGWFREGRRCATSTDDGRAGSAIRCRRETKIIERRAHHLDEFGLVFARPNLPRRHAEPDLATQVAADTWLCPPIISKMLQWFGSPREFRRNRLTTVDWPLGGAHRHCCSR